MFLSTVEKQVDKKRRIVLPQDFRAAAAGAFDGVYCFPSFENECLEGGGQAFFDAYLTMIDELPFGNQTRSAIETAVLGGMVELAFDPAGRILLPDGIEGMGVDDFVSLVGLRDRFQIWPREAFKIHRARQRELAREGLYALRAQQQQAGVRT